MGLTKSSTGTRLLENKFICFKNENGFTVALAGNPNVGKSTLISVVSQAKPVIADYHFTTITPVLGVVRMHEDSCYW